jgi:hypothetical protein
MLEPVADQERVVFVEIAVVEHQKEFGSIRIEPLDGVRDTCREIPEIADTHVVNEVPPLRVNRRNAGGPVKHVGPFSFLMPM